MVIVFFLSDAIPMFFDTPYPRYWCDYLDTTSIDNVDNVFDGFSILLVGFHDFPRYIHSFLLFILISGWLSWLSRFFHFFKLTSTVRFFAKPSGPMFLRFNDHLMRLFDYFLWSSTIGPAIFAMYRSSLGSSKQKQCACLEHLEVFLISIKAMPIAQHQQTTPPFHLPTIQHLKHPQARRKTIHVRENTAKEIKQRSRKWWISV